jgi:hypothetical protein
MGYKLFGVRLLFFALFLPFTLLAQFTYTMDQSVPVEINGILLKNPWAGGLNSAQVNMMDLNVDGVSDIVIFDKTTARISTFLYVNNAYRYAPEYETLFPDELSTFVVLRDYNCDGKKDIFTFGQIGILVFQQVTQTGKPFAWKKLSFYNSDTGLFSEVLLTKGFTSKINLLPGSNDLPNFTDMDGDGDLDVLNMRFVSPSTAEYHKNFSMERYGVCDSLDLERQTSKWGQFLECSCGKIAFGSQTCADIGGRTNHTGGKALLTMDTDNDGDKDLVFTEETCSFLYHMENQGTTAVPVLGNTKTFPLDNPIGIATYPAPYLEDVSQDGIADLVISINLNARNQPYNDFKASLWYYQNTGTNQSPVFELQQPDFLQDEMIEVGDLSAPAFADLDLDGDLDFVVGAFIDPINLRATLTLFENTGSPTSPSYRKVTDNFANLGFTSLYNIRPQFVDIDRNGGLDLAFTATGGGLTRLFYLLSTTNSAPSFDGQTLLVMDIPLAQNANATLLDVDQDGHLDVLTGTATGALSYWRNSGTGGYLFTLEDDSYMGLGESLSRQYVSVAVGDLDGDGREDLITGDYEGNLLVFGDFRATASAPAPESNLVFDVFSNQYAARDFGGSTRPVVANILGVDRPSIIVGNRQGGLHLLKHDLSKPLDITPKVSISPNPVLNGGSLTILADRSVTIEIYTALGARVGNPQVIPGNQTTNYPVQILASGLYIARFTAGSKTIGIRFIVR